jgi:hypothetical protein
VKGKAAPAKTAEKPAPEPVQSLDLFAGLNSHQTARRPA